MFVLIYVKNSLMEVTFIKIGLEVKK